MFTSAQFLWLAYEVGTSAVFNHLFLANLLVIAAFWTIAALTAILGSVFRYTLLSLIFINQLMIHGNRISSWTSALTLPLLSAPIR